MLVLNTKEKLLKKYCETNLNAFNPTPGVSLLPVFRLQAHCSVITRSDLKVFTFSSFSISHVLLINHHTIRFPSLTQVRAVVAAG